MDDDDIEEQHAPTNGHNQSVVDLIEVVKEDLVEYVDSITVAVMAAIVFAAPDFEMDAKEAAATAWRLLRESRGEEE